MLTDMIVFKKYVRNFLFILGIILILCSYFIAKDLSTTLIEDSIEEFNFQKFSVLVGSFWLSGMMCCLHSIFKR